MVKSLQRKIRGAHATRVLVWATRPNNLFSLQERCARDWCCNFVTKAATIFRLITVGLLTLGAPCLFAGVVLDGSFGTSGALPGPNYMISANLGKQVGNNLFQSFSQFNLISSESATFTGPSNIQNILSRVTGGPSSIDGKISSQIQGANLFFLNPAGVVFGPHAQLDVSGSFAVTTADYVKLVGGGRFNANLGGQDTLVSTPVSSFGFLNAAPATVSITGTNTRDSDGIITSTSSLSAAPQKCFSIVAGDIALNGSTITGQGARVNMVSVKSPGEVQLDATDMNSVVDVTQFTAMGEIDVTNAANIDTSGFGGGPVVIRGGSLNLLNSQISSNTTGPARGGAIDIILLNSVVIDRGVVATDSSGEGNAGNIMLQAGDVRLNNSVVSTASFGNGNAGDVTVTGDSVLIESSALFSDASGLGTAGNLILHARNLVIGDSDVLTSPFGSGKGGDVTLTADSIVIQDGSFIETESLGSGKGGGVTLTAKSIVIDGSEVFTTGDTGDAGDVTLTANSLVIEDSDVFADAFGSGNAGNVTLTAHSILIQDFGFVSSSTSGVGKGGNVTLVADSIVIRDNFSGVDTSTYGSANGGEVTLISNSILIQNSGFLSSDTFGSGDAGDVMLQVRDLKINNSYVSTETVENGTGNAGNIMVQARNLKITHGGNIGANSFANGGNIHITASDLVYLIDSSITATAGSQQTASGGGTGGNITIDPLLIVLNNSLISANAAAGQGGNIMLISDFFLNSGSLITATGTTNNGTVTITAPALDLGAELITLPSSLVSAENQLRERCTALLQGDFSSFISIGRGGTEPEPDELQTEF
jgi:filamentous hemagglutinin family protein